MARYVLIDKRSGRLCEFLDFTHGETADLFWIDVTDRPEVTLEWTWHEGEFIAPPPRPAETQETGADDYGTRPYTFDAGAGIPRHQHPFAHDHVVEAGKTVVVIEGLAPIFCAPGSPPVILPADIFHGITALENGTRFLNKRVV